jgi:hypothetical protein
MYIKPITVAIHAYGTKANLAAIRTRALAHLAEELGKAPKDAVADLDGADAHAAIVAAIGEDAAALKKPTPAQAGIRIVLPEVNERATVAWLGELPVARTCVLCAAWDSPRERLRWRMLVADGDRSSSSTALG